METNYTFLDLDGVILDSEQRVKVLINKFQPNSKSEWEEFFDSINWRELLEDSKPINNSVEIIKELELMKKKLMILTKIHTFDEMKAKTFDLRENRKITLPILFVPPHVRKSQIYMPTQHEILIDDSQKNIDDWIKNGGNGILFDEMCEKETKNKVRSLEFLLKR